PAGTSTRTPRGRTTAISRYRPAGSESPRISAAETCTPYSRASPGSSRTGTTDSTQLTCRACTHSSRPPSRRASSSTTHPSGNVRSASRSVRLSTRTHAWSCTGSRSSTSPPARYAIPSRTRGSGTSPLPPPPAPAEQPPTPSARNNNLNRRLDPNNETSIGATVAAIQPFRVVHEHEHVHVHGVTFAEVLPCRVERGRRYEYVLGHGSIPRRKASSRPRHP